MNKKISRVMRIVINITMYKLLPLPIALVGSIVVSIVINKLTNLN